MPSYHVRLQVGTATNAPDVRWQGDENGNACVAIVGENTLVTSGTITLNGTTEVLKAITIPSSLSSGGVYAIKARNPSKTQTMSIYVYNVSVFPGQSSQEADYVTSFECGTAGSRTGRRTQPVQAWCIGSAAKIGFVLSGSGTGVAAYQVFRI